MSRINEKLGMRPAGHRKRLDCLSGVACPNCPHTDVASYVERDHRLKWRCRACGFAWYPTVADIETYNDRVRPRDRIAG